MHSQVLRVQDSAAKNYRKALKQRFNATFIQWRPKAKQFFDNPSSLNNNTTFIMQAQSGSMLQTIVRQNAQVMRAVHKFQMDFLGLKSTDEIYKRSKALIPGLSARIGQAQSGSINNTTEKVLRTANNMIAEDSTPERGIVHAQERLSGGIADRRAKNVADTNAHTAGNAIIQAIGDLVISLGLPAFKTWMSRRDSRVRSTHRQADGQTVRMNESFKVGGVSLKQPGDPSGPPEEVINCRCYVIVKQRPGKKIP